MPVRSTRNYFPSLYFKFYNSIRLWNTLSRMSLIENNIYRVHGRCDNYKDSLICDIFLVNVTWLSKRSSHLQVLHKCVESKDIRGLLQVFGEGVKLGSPIPNSLYEETALHIGLYLFSPTTNSCFNLFTTSLLKISQNVPYSRL